jgi:hypothetical protein
MTYKFEQKYVERVCKLILERALAKGMISEIRDIATITDIYIVNIEYEKKDKKD